MTCKLKISKSLILGFLLHTSLSTKAWAQHHHTPSVSGLIGLNTVPSARMDKEGTVRLGASYLDPYLHSYLGIQISKPLFINVRRSVETSNPFKDAEQVTPSADFKLKLKKENAYTPEIALGIQSALGHRKQSGEFIAASKRYNNFDITAGIGWGRYGTAGHINNPLKIINNNFASKRDIESSRNNTPSNWFRGEKVGFFVGVEYFLPTKGLSLKIDYGADRYAVEKAQSETFNAPSPFGIGLSYTPTQWINAGFGLQGKNKITARLNLKANIKNWQHTPSNQTHNKIKLLQTPPVTNLDKIYIQGKTVHAITTIPNNLSTPEHLANLIAHIEDDYSEQINQTKQYAITIKKSKIRGKTLYIPRKKYLEQLKTKTHSAEELWNITAIENKLPITSKKKQILPRKGIKARQILSLTLENHLSVTEERTGTLYRSSLITAARDIPFFNTINGAALRLNIIGNNKKIDSYSPINIPTVRSDLSGFSSKRIALENAYLGWVYSMPQQLHFLALGGYLEELHAGIGGEILYRPYKARYAIGADVWHINKRKPNTMINAGITNNSATTAFANFWYNIPKYEVTASLKAGRYIAGDHGAEIALQKQFKNGANLSAKIALTNARELNAFGDDLTTFHSLNLTLPFYNIPYLNASTHVKTKIEPFARNAAQRLKKPIDLYTETTPLGKNHIASHWNKISE